MPNAEGAAGVSALVAVVENVDVVAREVAEAVNDAVATGVAIEVVVAVSVGLKVEVAKNEICFSSAFGIPDALVRVGAIGKTRTLTIISKEALRRKARFRAKRDQGM